MTGDVRDFSPSGRPAFEPVAAVIQVPLPRFLRMDTVSMAPQSTFERPQSLNALFPE